MTSKKARINLECIPTHVAIIMDGNGRWARARGEERTYGHKKGVDSVRAVLRAAEDLGVKVLTLYTFSEENWCRPEEEVEALMELLVTCLVEEKDELVKNKIRLSAIGEIEHLPENTRQTLNEVMELTKDNTGAELVLALNYSGRSEMLRAVNELLAEGVRDVSEEQFRSKLFTGRRPDPDLMIRTGGEKRVSNFLLWQMAYTEFYFTPTFWPDFGEEEFYEAILEYQSRERRFGMTGEQLSGGESNN